MVNKQISEYDFEFKKRKTLFHLKTSIAITCIFVIGLQMYGDKIQRDKRMKYDPKTQKGIEDTPMSEYDKMVFRNEDEQKTRETRKKRSVYESRNMASHRENADALKFMKSNKVYKRKMEMDDDIKKLVNDAVKPCDGIYDYACGASDKQQKYSRSTIHTRELNSERTRKVVDRLMDSQFAPQLRRAQFTRIVDYIGKLDHYHASGSGDGGVVLVDGLLDNIGGWCLNENWQESKWEANKAFITLLREGKQSIFKVDTYIVDNFIDVTLFIDDMNTDTLVKLSVIYSRAYTNKNVPNSHNRMMVDYKSMLHSQESRSEPTNVYLMEHLETQFTNVCWSCILDSFSPETDDAFRGRTFKIHTTPSMLRFINHMMSKPMKVMTNHMFSVIYLQSYNYILPTKYLNKDIFRKLATPHVTYFKKLQANDGVIMNFDTGSRENDRFRVEETLFGYSSAKHSCSPKVRLLFTTYMRKELLTSRLAELFPLLLSKAETQLYPVDTKGIAPMVTSIKDAYIREVRSIRQITQSDREVMVTKILDTMILNTAQHIDKIAVDGDYVTKAEFPWNNKSDKLPVVYIGLPVIIKSLILAIRYYEFVKAPLAYYTTLKKTLTGDDGYFDGNCNCIVFMQRLLAYPAITKDDRLYLDYAILGTTMAHEMSHSFKYSNNIYFSDLVQSIKNNKQFDQTGNVFGSDYLKCIGIHYEQYNATYGNMTNKVYPMGIMDEGLADIDGISISFQAYKHTSQLQNRRYSNIQDKQFFINYAAYWCVPASLVKRYVFILPYIIHPSNLIRTNALYPLLDSFREVYKCPWGSMMNPIGHGWSCFNRRR